MNNLSPRCDDCMASSNSQWTSIPIGNNEHSQEASKNLSAAVPGWESISAPQTKTEAEPKIFINTKSVIFGRVRLKHPTTRSIQVTNRGSADLIIRNVSILGSGQQNFRLKSTCSVLPPGNTSTIFIAFTPLAAGIKMGYLNISSNDPKEAASQVYLRGSGQEID